MTRDKRGSTILLGFAGLLLAFTLVLAWVRPPLWVVGSACIGALFNPLGFLASRLEPVS